MNFYVIKIQNFCDRAKPWLGKVEALFHAIHPLLLGYEKRVCRNFDTPSFGRKIWLMLLFSMVLQRTGEDRMP